MLPTSPASQDKLADLITEWINANPKLSRRYAHPIIGTWLIDLASANEPFYVSKQKMIWGCEVAQNLLVLHFGKTTIVGYLAPDIVVPDSSTNESSIAHFVQENSDHWVILPDEGSEVERTAEWDYDDGRLIVVLSTLTALEKLVPESAEHGTELLVAISIASGARSFHFDLATKGVTYFD